MRQTFEKLRAKFPFLENASEDNEEATYTLRLSQRLVGEGCWPVKDGCMELSGFTFGLVPAYEWTTREYQVGWQDTSGTITYHHEGRMKQGIVVQLWLVWALPANAVTGPLWPTHVRRPWPELTSQSFSDLSALAEASDRPLGAKATAYTSPVWPSKVACSCRVSRFHSVIVRP